MGYIFSKIKLFLISVQKILTFMAYNFYWYKNMNSTFVVISTLVKSNIEEKCFTNCLMNVSTKALKDYLECANI